MVDRTKTEQRQQATAKQIEPYRAFPIDVLPNTVGQFVRAAATAIGCDASFIALPLLGCLARAIGNKRTIKLKRTWAEPAIIWAAIVGRSGTRKSPAIAHAMHFLQRRQLEAITEFTEAGAKYEQELAIYERDLALWRRAKKGPTEPPPWSPQEPVCERYVTTDCTIEALASLLAAQFDGVLVARDELAGWLSGIAEYKGGKGSDLGHWLASWSAAPLTVDRKTGAIKMLHVPRAAVSIIGGVQPGILKKSIGFEHMKDGLCARLLLAMPDATPSTWTEAIIDPPIEQAMNSVFDRLLSLDPGADEDGNTAPFPIPLSPEAKARWVEHYDRHRAELSDLDDDLAAAWSKLEAYAARFALIFQLCSWAAGELLATADTIDEPAMKSAIALADWFGGEARRVYGVLAECDAETEQRELIEWIKRRGGTVTVRELQQGHRRFATATQAELALQQLVKAEFGSWSVEHTRTKQRCQFNLKAPSASTDSPILRELHESVDVDSVDSPNGHERNGSDQDVINRLFQESVDEGGAA